MAYETKMVPTKQRTGTVICDACGKIDTLGQNTFELKHRFGADSIREGGTVSATICDTCLMRLLLERVPHAIFEDEYGMVTDRQGLAELRNELKDDAPSSSGSDSSVRTLTPDDFRRSRD